MTEYLEEVREEHPHIPHVYLANPCSWSRDGWLINWPNVMAKIKADYLPPNMKIPADEIPNSLTKQWREMADSNPNVVFVREMNFISEVNDKIVGFIPVSQLEKSTSPASILEKISHTTSQIMRYAFGCPQVEWRVIHYTELADKWDKEELTTRLKSHIQEKCEGEENSNENEVFIVLNGVDPDQIFRIPELNEEDEIYECKEEYAKQTIILHPDQLFEETGVTTYSPF